MKSLLLFCFVFFTGTIAFKCSVIFQCLRSSKQSSSVTRMLIHSPWLQMLVFLRHKQSKELFQRGFVRQRFLNVKIFQILTVMFFEKKIKISKSRFFREDKQGEVMQVVN